MNEVEVTVVKQSGVNRLSETSVKPKTHSLLLWKLIEVTVYTTCEKQLNNEKIIAASFRRDSVPQNAPSAPRRSGNLSINFKATVFFALDKFMRTSKSCR